MSLIKKGALKVFINNEFDGYTSFGLDYINRNVDKMRERKPRVKNGDKHFGKLVYLQEIENGYMIITDEENFIKHVEV